MESFLFLFIFNRNTSKNAALDVTNFVVFFTKVVFDASSKLILFGAWMFTYNQWNLSPALIVAYYYGIMSLLMMVNIVFSLIEKENLISLRNMIGNSISYILMTNKEFCLSSPFLLQKEQLKDQQCVVS